MPAQNLILAVDSCFDSCSAAVFDGASVLAHVFESMQRGQAERLAPMVSEMLGVIGAPVLSRVAVTTGPGTFTGVRIGLSFARSFALAQSVPCLGIDSLQVMALAEGLEGVRAGVHPAPQGCVYMHAFRDGAPLAPPALLSMDAALAQLPDGELLLAGGAAIALAQKLGRRAQILPANLPDAAALARLAYNLPVPEGPPDPVYLRAPDLRTPKNKQIRQTGSAA